jgi:NAD(P)-dependent dehydrogenase (short-subunit alcohol dehydrogenase family)
MMQNITAPLLHDRTAVVTGGGSGLGRVMARALVAAGSRVVLVGRTKDTLLETADELGHESTRVCVADVAEPESVSGLVAELADEQVTVLVNNAGIGGPVRPITEIEPGEWDEVFATNVRSVYLMSRAFLPGMVAAGGGDIVNLASVSGKRPLVRRTPYTASKMAVIGLTRTLAAEVGECGIRVNTLSPGFVRGPRMVRNFRLQSEATGVPVAEIEESFVSRTALHRMVTEDEVGAALVALLSMTALSGADIDLSAGMVAP